jgi:hypothetical protein
MFNKLNTFFLLILLLFALGCNASTNTSTRTPESYGNDHGKDFIESTKNKNSAAMSVLVADIFNPEGSIIQDWCIDRAIDVDLELDLGWDNEEIVDSAFACMSVIQEGFGK